MSKLMSVLGVILLAVGLVLGLLEIMQPGRIQGLGISIDSAIHLIVGGVLALGLGGVIAALQNGVPALAADAPLPDEEPAPAPAAETAEVDAEPAPAPAEDKPARPRFGFGKKLAAGTAAAGVATASEAAASADAAVTSPAVQDTIDALEQAKKDITGALGGVESISAPSTPAEPVSESVEDEAPTEDVGGEDELYVIEEKMIRGRPARILSDSTVEAETDEGWMRFENLEHLNEYLDAAGQ